MAYFNSLDLGIIILYLAGIIGLGVWVGGKQTNLKDYFLGSGQVPWWVSGLSIVATETSAVTFISIPALAFGGDISFLQVVLGYLVARVLLASFVVPLYFKGEIYSPYQLLGDRFGMSAQKMVAFLFLMAGVLAAGVRVYVTCIPLQLMFGLAESQIIIVILFFVIASLVYTLIGGVKAVVWTDAVQFFVFTFGGVFALCFAVYHIDGGWGNAVAQASEGGKLLWFRTGFEGESKPFITSLFSGSLNIWMGVIGAAFLAFSSHGADQLIVQRVLACGNAADGRKAMVLSAVVILPLFALFLFVGVGLWVFYQANPVVPIEIPEIRPGVKKNDYLFPIFILTEIPHGVRGFLVVGILCAAMSSVSSALSALASVSVKDVLGPLVSTKDERRLLGLSRRITLFWGGALILVAFLTQKVESVLTTAFSLSGLTSGALLGGVGLAVFGARLRSHAVVMGMVSSVLVMIFVKSMTPIAWPWYTLLGASVTLVVSFTFGRLGGHRD